MKLGSIAFVGPMTTKPAFAALVLRVRYFWSLPSRELPFSTCLVLAAVLFPSSLAVRLRLATATMIASVAIVDFWCSLPLIGWVARQASLIMVALKQ